MSLRVSSSRTEGIPLQQKHRHKSARSRTGCTACRQRRKKCGEEKPRCKNCERLGLECEGQETLQLRKKIESRGGLSIVFSLNPDSSGREEPTSKLYHSSRTMQYADGQVDVPKRPSDNSAACSSEAPETLRADDLIIPSPHDILDGSYQLLMEDSDRSPEAMNHASESSATANTEIVGIDFDTGDVGSTFWPGSIPLDPLVDLREAPNDSSLDDWSNLVTETNPTASPCLPLSLDEWWSNQPTITQLDTDLQPQDQVPIPTSGDHNPYDVTIPPSIPITVKSALEQHLFQYFVDKLCHLLSASHDAAHNDYLCYLAPLALFEPCIYTAITAFSAGHLSLSMPVYKPMASKLRKQAHLTSLQAMKRAEACSTGGYLDEISLLSSILMNSIEITDGIDPEIGRRLQRCKQAIRKKWAAQPLVSDAVRWILRNIAFHDVLCTSSMLTGDIIISPQWWTAGDDNVDTIMGACQSIFRLLGKIGQLCHIQRRVTHQGGDFHSDMQSVYLEAKLLETKLDNLKSPSGLDLQHQLMFELHRSATRLFLFNCVYKINAASLIVQQEVSQIRINRNALLSEPHPQTEDIQAQNRGALHTSHWIVFNAAVNSIDSPETVYEDYFAHMQEFSFRNVEKSLEVVQKVWRLNQNGKVAVSWLEVVEAENIELVFV